MLPGCSGRGDRSARRPSGVRDAAGSAAAVFGLLWLVTHVDEASAQCRVDGRAVPFVREVRVQPTGGASIDMDVTGADIGVMPGTRLSELVQVDVRGTLAFTGSARLDSVHLVVDEQFGGSLLRLGSPLSTQIIRISESSDRVNITAIVWGLGDFTGEVPCANISMLSAEGPRRRPHLRNPNGNDPGATETIRYLAARRLVIHESPGGGGASLTWRPVRWMPVRVLEVRGRESHIQAALDDGTVLSGWVESRSLSSRRPEPGPGTLAPIAHGIGGGCAPEGARRALVAAGTTVEAANGSPWATVTVDSELLVIIDDTNETRANILQVPGLNVRSHDCGGFAFVPLTRVRFLEHP